MKKIPLIYLYLTEDGKPMVVTDIPTPACQWVFDGEGIATQKLDGTACLVKDGVLYKRRMVKPGRRTPDGFMLVEVDPNTGKQFGWVPANVDANEDRYLLGAFVRLCGGVEIENGKYPKEGTYELLGPKVQGNPENYSEHVLVAHGQPPFLHNVPREYEALKEWLRPRDIEGIVFHHTGGRMAKIRKKDFGLSRKP